jgi:uncharacterized protein with PQ loop repeat
MVNPGLRLLHKRLVSDRTKRWYDKYILMVVVAAPLTNLPQLLRVWGGKDATGVSAVSWTFFSLISISWFFYGIIHNDRYIISMNLALMAIQALIALGAIIY